MSRTHQSPSLTPVRSLPQRAHVPYHADDLAQGKRTGAAIDNVAHGSDGIEPFDEVLTQADAVAASLHMGRHKAKAAGKVATAFNDDEDDYGGMSMDIDDS